MAESTPHVLIIGIDGVRWDAVCRLPTPAIDEVAARGFLVPVRVDEVAPTISGPSWASIFTGTTADTHLIMDNDLSTGTLADHPDVLTLAARRRPGVATFAAAGWGPLVRAESGGPLLAGGGHYPAGLTADTAAEWSRVDDEVVDVSTAFLRDHEGSAGSLAFAYLHGVDALGHTIGTGPDYDTMIMDSDARVRTLLDAVAQRVGEDWTVIVATDHGHRDGGGHGGDDVHERTAWVAAYGPEVPQPLPDDRVVEQVDVAAHVLHVFGIDPDDPTMVGRPFGDRHGPA